MKKIIAIISLVFATSTHAGDNQLTDAEKTTGWRLLFDGHSMSQWRNYQQTGLSEKWQVKSGEMVLTEAGGGDILTKESFDNYELKIDWKISEVGNSGIFVMVDEEGPQIYSHAPEIQLLDNENHWDNKFDNRLSGSLYDLIASPKSSHKKAGEWNQVRILLEDTHLQVWQNQVQTVDIHIGSEQWDRLVAESKFATWEGFGQNAGGHIGLQDHGDVVSFKNIKVREF
ncbi:MAG: DUF1080 domain-containing protein [Pseudomonadales bacterium]